MDVGVIFPQWELSGDSSALDCYGRNVEAFGYDYILMFDHVAGADHARRNPPLTGPFTYEHSFHEPLMALAYVAGITKRIGLATGVIILPQRQTILAARQIADLDLFSGGRVRLGVGVGWNYVEFEALGQNFQTRGKRIGEQVALMHRLWAEPLLEFRGEFDTVDRAAINPRPQRRIPIYGGGSSDAAYKRAAKILDGFIFSGAANGNALPGWEKIKSLLASENRPVAGFGAEYLIPPGIHASMAVDLIQRWQDIGGTHAAISTLGHGFTAINQHLDYLNEVRGRLT